MAEVLSATSLLVNSTEDHLRALGLLLADENSRYAPLSVARVALESAARAWWMLDITATLPERLCRGWNFLLYGHHERKKLEQELGGPDTRTAKIRVIIETAKQLGLPLAASKKGSPRWLKGGLRDATSLCRELLCDDMDQDSTLGSVMYRYLTATSHGAMHGLLKKTSFVEGMPAGATGTLVAIEFDRRELALTAVGAYNAYLKATEQQFQYFGWRTPEWDKWRQGIDDILWYYLKNPPPR